MNDQNKGQQKRIKANFVITHYSSWSADIEQVIGPSKVKMAFN